MKLVSLLISLLPGGLILLLGSCGAPVAPRSQQGAIPFTVGESYRTTRKVSVSQRGDALLLSGDPDELRRIDPETKTLHQLPPGTLVEVKGMRRYNTHTHGVQMVPVGEIQSGRWSGTTVEMAQQSLSSRFERTSP